MDLLVWTFPVNGIIRFVAFGVWPISLSITFSRFIHPTAGIGQNLAHFSWLSNIPLSAETSFCLSICCRLFPLFLPCGYCDWSCSERPRTSFYGNTCSQFSWVNYPGADRLGHLGTLRQVGVQAHLADERSTSPCEPPQDHVAHIFLAQCYFIIKVCVLIVACRTIF